MPLLQNQIAVITGAGSGIGRAIAIGYAREGARVVALDVNAESAKETAKLVSDAGGTANSFALDVAYRAACAAMAKQDRRHHRPGLHPGQQRRHRAAQRHDRRSAKP